MFIFLAYLGVRNMYAFGSVHGLLFVYSSAA